MPCKICQAQWVWKFTNQRTLCSSCFVKYFEKKVKSTIRKYNMPISKIKGNSLKANIINNIIKELPERKGKISEDSLNNLSSYILYTVMHGNIDNLKKFIPKNQPLYFLSDKEILLYAKIKKIKGKIEKKKSKDKEIDDFVKHIEQKNPDIRQNVVNAMLKLKY